MARVDVQQHVVLESVVSHLRTELLLDDRQCYMAVDPRRPVIPMGGDYWLSVSPGDGRFDDALAIGSVINQCMEDAIITVTGYTRVFLDDSNRDTQLMTLETRGLLRVKRTILKALAGKDLQIEVEEIDERDADAITLRDGERITTRGDTFARSLATPVYAHRPEVGYLDDSDTSIGIAFISIDFAIPFDWDLA